MRYLLFILISQILFGTAVFSQNYTSYFTGNTTDLQTKPASGICLMGGATEDDNAMTWFLKQANGGDVLVLRASGSDGYNDFLYSQLGVKINSVETIVFHNVMAANDAYIHQKILQAEAIWFAGGDQWDYISYWRNTPIDSLINDGISNRNIVIGGTSAGMAIQGGFYYSAENGTVTSAAALTNPYNTRVTIDSSSFISNKYLEDVITDTHYDNPDRKGRHLVFLSRILVDLGIKAKGIACDEYTAVCIDKNGIAKVFGGYPTYDDNAYFIQPNCELTDVTPENNSAGNPLDWNLGEKAITVYEVKGTSSGTNTFDLNNWVSGTGGFWRHWYIANGVLNETAGTRPNCSPLSIPSSHGKGAAFKIYPNPATDVVTIELNNLKPMPETLRIINQYGQVKKEVKISGVNQFLLQVKQLSTGIYFIEITLKDKNKRIQKLVLH